MTSSPIDAWDRVPPHDQLESWAAFSDALGITPRDICKLGFKGALRKADDDFRS